MPIRKPPPGASSSNKLPLAGGTPTKNFTQQRKLIQSPHPAFARLAQRASPPAHGALGTSAAETMGEYRLMALEPSEECSEERTEPFSQSEYDYRFKTLRVEESVSAPTTPVVPLDELFVDDSHHKKGIRILVRDLTNSRSVSPGPDNSCEWLALRAEIAAQDEPEHQVLAVTQTHKDIKFEVRIPGERCDEDGRPRPLLWCDIYYHPESDHLILRNKSDDPFSLSRLSKNAPSSPAATHLIEPYQTRTLSPGTWRISFHETPVLDFRILEKRPVTLFPPLPAPPVTVESPSSSFKRKPLEEHDEDDGRNGRGEKKARIAVDAPPPEKKDGVIMFLRESAQPLVFPIPNGSEGKQLSTNSAQPLLDVKEGETVSIPGPGEIDEYQVSKRSQIASTSLSSVYTADHSNVPGGVVTVKVLKTKAPASSRPNESEWNVIRQADMWLREYQSQDELEHDSIVKLYGGDARFLSLYMEHVKAKDLSSKTNWRCHLSDNFLGGRQDASRILRDISGALEYLHTRNMVHNDIKPANILYSRERGAVLCDFGLSTRQDKDNMKTTGGTPFYVPPEFIGNKIRGPPSDVWALGITMLYLLGKIPFPDARGAARHPRRLYWQIAEVNKRNKYGSDVTSAVGQMQVWLSEIAEAKKTLDLKDPLERLVMDMLVPNPHQRATMKRVMGEMFEE